MSWPTFSPIRKTKVDRCNSRTIQARKNEKQTESANEIHLFLLIRLLSEKSN